MNNLPLSQPASQQDTRWKSLIDPVLGNPLINGRLLTNIALSSGSNIINHGLGRKLQGYIPVLNSAAATFHDSQTTNSSPQLTLVLVASAATTISLWVF
jgi:hypothetical protein